MLHFDWNFLWVFINLIIFFILMRIFLFKPIKKILDERRKLIDEQFKRADDAENQASQLKEQYSSRLETVEDEKRQILADARAKAKNEYDGIMSRAYTEAERIKSDAKKAAELETKKARLSVNEEIARLAMEAAEKVVSEKASAQTDNAIYNNFLSKGSDGNES